MRHFTRVASLVLPLAAMAGCATARNYEDPAAPIHSGGSATPKAPGRTLRVVTFNLKWGRAVEEAAALLSRPGTPLADADLIVLQEMDQGGTARVAQALGYHYFYVPSAVHPVAKQDFGVALLSPWPLEDGRKLLLPHHNLFRRLRRSAAVATLRSPLGPVRIYGIHFESPGGALGSVRRDQARAVIADAEDWSGPTLVAGDFNGRGGPRELARAGYGWPTESVTNTIGIFDFDHIVARGLCPAGPEASGKTEATPASDHKPVWAVLEPCAARGVPPRAAEPAEAAPVRSGSRPAPRSAS